MARAHTLKFSPEGGVTDTNLCRERENFFFIKKSGNNDSCSCASQWPLDLAYNWTSTAHWQPTRTWLSKRWVEVSADPLGEELHGSKSPERASDLLRPPRKGSNCLRDPSISTSRMEDPYRKLRPLRRSIHKHQTNQVSPRTSGSKEALSLLDGDDKKWEKRGVPCIAWDS